MRTPTRSVLLAVASASLWLFGAGSSSVAPPATATGENQPAKERRPVQRPAPFADEPAAHALYDKMMAAMRDATSLVYQSDYTLKGVRGYASHATYTVWLKKPNYFRLEAASCADHSESGVIVGDGDFLWLYWPNGRPHFFPYDADSTQRKFPDVYMNEPAPPGMHSIGHKTMLLGVGMSMPILDPSTFHGYTDSLQAYLDAVRTVGVEKVGDEEFDVIEASMMKGQRSWVLWLSRRDHLPRKLKEIVRVSFDLIITEVWSNVVVNGEIADEKFHWQPPAGWTQWREPEIDDLLLKPGTLAPDFTFKTIDGATVKLSDLRSKVVWIWIWRYG
jgi:outer membrane lipoprotein-sorting protein